MAARQKNQFTDILIRLGILSLDQLDEADQMARQSGMKLQEALVRLGYASGEEVARALAEQHSMDYVSLADVTIPPDVVELVPRIGRPRKRDPPSGRRRRHAEDRCQRSGRLRHL